MNSGLTMVKTVINTLGADDMVKITSARTGNIFYWGSAAGVHKYLEYELCNVREGVAYDVDGKAYLVTFINLLQY